MCLLICLVAYVFLRRIEKKVEQLESGGYWLLFEQGVSYLSVCIMVMEGVCVCVCISVLQSVCIMVMETRLIVNK